MSIIAGFINVVLLTILLIVSSIAHAQSTSSAPASPETGSKFAQSQHSTSNAIPRAPEPLWVRKLAAQQSHEVPSSPGAIDAVGQPLVNFQPEHFAEPSSSAGLDSQLRFVPTAPLLNTIDISEEEVPLPEASAAPAPQFTAETEQDSLYLPSISDEFAPWWQKHAVRSLRATQPIHLDLETLVLEAMMHSHHIKAISRNYSISRTAITEAAGAFDARAFTESKFVSTNEPVGNKLTTGGPPRLLNDDWYLNAGIRNRTQWGGSVELAQKIGLQDSNSVFFLPANQGNARLSLSFSQPLLNGAGRPYNDSLTVLAKIDSRIALAQTSQELQKHLVEVNRAYWELYLQRAAALQKQRSWERAESILKEAESRQSYDTLQSQVLRVRAAVSGRRSEFIRASAAAENAESQIRALTNAPHFGGAGAPELIPIEPPAVEFIGVELRDALASALQNRPEVDQAMRQIRAAKVRLKVSEKELLPALNLVFESYVSGLRGNSDIGAAYRDQFSTGTPGFTAGLIFEMPLTNRAACARYQRRQFELEQMTEQLQATLALVSAEVEIAVREVSTTYSEMRSGYEAMVAMQAEENYLYERWQSPVTGDERPASSALDDLLDVQQRLAAEEFNYAKAQVNYSLALLELKRATGTLLQYESINPHDSCEPQPALIVGQGPTIGSGLRLARLPRP